VSHSARVYAGAAVLGLIAGVACPQTRQPATQIIVEASESPDLQSWMDAGRATLDAWLPRIVALLRDPSFVPPLRVRLVLKKGMKGVAATGGNTIRVAEPWIRAHPEDVGMLIHEMTHVVQAYPRAEPGWVTEGIADYVRFLVYEPGREFARIDPVRSRYSDGYRTSAAFLGFVEKRYGPGFIAWLNAAMRAGAYRDELFREQTGKPLDALWKEFLDALRDGTSGVPGVHLAR
jgi:hypothetical protein